ncbi:MAG: DUF4093 domain-containing protein [Bacillota bacterium]|nr:DUF4093 domain-containing protein [Bacillota bacterium]
MIAIKEVIIVEGRYDKNKLKQIFSSPVIETGGFAIFKDREKLNLIRRMADTRGILILTDSDGSGFVIRNFLKGAVSGGGIKHAYIPDIFGKEKRKIKASAEGKLGVEGINDDIIIEAVRRAGALPSENGNAEKITKGDLYEAGLYGREDSAVRRRELYRKLSLPERLSSNAFLEISDCILTKAEFLTLTEDVR